MLFNFGTLSHGGASFASLFRRGGTPRAVVPLALALLCACGGGGGGGSVPGGPGTPAPTSGPATASVTFTLLVPRAAASAVRRPQYVSSATQSIRITVNGGTPVVMNVSATSQGCATTSQGVQCTIAAPAPIGTDTIFVELFGQPGAAGPVLSKGTTTATVVAGSANNVTMTLNGVVAKIVLSLANSAPQQGTPATIPLTVTMQDAAGATIIGDPFQNPVTLIDSDTSGATSLSKTAIASPADAAGVTVSYSGAAVGSATFGATAAGVPASAVTTATLSPKSSGSTALIDWPTYAYDNRRDGFNPSSNALTPSSFAQLHLAWTTSYNNDYNTPTQPVLATGLPNHAGLLYVGGALGIIYAFDALTGAEAWRTPLGNEDYSCASGSTSKLGIGGTVTYDPSSRTIYVPHNSNTGLGTAASNAVVQLDAATGSPLGKVEVSPQLLAGEINFLHTATAIAGGQVYVGTSATCDLSSWRGRVASVNATMTGSPRIFYTAYGRGGNFSGGGVWGWGGVAIDDAGQVYAGVGNADNTTGSGGPKSPPFDQTTDETAGYGDHLIQLSSDLSTLVAQNNPGYTIAGSSDDLDFAGSPVLFRPVGCNDMLLAAQGKAGELLVYNTRTVGAGPIGRFRISPSTNEAGDIGNPAWSPLTGLLYVSVNSATGGSIDPPGIIALRPAGCNSATTLAVAWHTAFGPDSYTGSIQPRSAPVVTAGGVIIESTPCTPDNSGGCLATIGASYGGAVWGLDASTGALLNGGKPLLMTNDHVRMPAVVSGQWVFVHDNAASLYGLTLDPNVPAIHAVRRTPLRHPNWYMTHHKRL